MAGAPVLEENGGISVIPRPAGGPSDFPGGR
jgi:hypothetical protein